MVTRPAPPHPAVGVLPLVLTRAPAHQLLLYTPDGPVGGTFTCTQCQAQGWQPELLDHAAGCPYRWPQDPAPGPAPR